MSSDGDSDILREERFTCARIARGSNTCYLYLKSIKSWYSGACGSDLSGAHRCNLEQWVGVPAVIAAFPRTAERRRCCLGALDETRCSPPEHVLLLAKVSPAIAQTAEVPPSLPKLTGPRSYPALGKTAVCGA